MSHRAGSERILQMQKIIPEISLNIWRAWALKNKESSGNLSTKAAYRPDTEIAENICWLLDRGYENQIVLGMDAGRVEGLASYRESVGRANGLEYLLTRFVPLLRKMSVSEEKIHKMLVENPSPIVSMPSPLPSNTFFIFCLHHHSCIFCHRIFHTKLKKALKYLIADAENIMNVLLYAAFAVHISAMVNFNVLEKLIQGLKMNHMLRIGFCLPLLNKCLQFIFQVFLIGVMLTKRSWILFCLRIFSY